MAEGSPAARSADGEHLARRVADYLWPRESLAHRLGMELEAIGVGHCTVALMVRQEHLNVQQFCHGGIIFTLADQAFALAANSRNDRSVTASCAIDYLQPVTPGERIRAVATEYARQGRAGYFDVNIERADGVPVAIMRARAMAIGGHLIDP